ncbi:MAG: acyl-CoA dehydratase activase-related protein [Bacillota bacterium]
MIVGIPRSLYYYYYYPFWAAFFQELGWSCQVSPPTSQSILQKGLSLALDEACLPVKMHFGHLAYLQDKVDVLFSPGFGRWGKGHFCPKLMGLPDLARMKFSRACEYWHDVDEAGCPGMDQWVAGMRKIAPGLKKRQIKDAWMDALKEHRTFLELCKTGYKPPEAIDYLVQRKAHVKLEKGMQLQIAVLGHPYLVYDELANQQFLQALAKNGVKVLTEEMVPESAAEMLEGMQGKAVFWPMGQRILSAGLYYSSCKVDGIVFLSACLCGPDAIIGELLGRYLQRTPGSPPLLKITLDEHTGRAGLQTRIEALLDLLDRSKKHAAL